MNFLQPWLLLALPFVLIPIIIHLVNQWRYQTKPWAAMIFLLAAKSMHRGMAKLRQWLILANAGVSDRGVDLRHQPSLDERSHGVGGGDESIRQSSCSIVRPVCCNRALSRENQIANRPSPVTANHTSQSSSRWILIESGRLAAQEFPTLQALLEAPVADGSSASANWPVLFQVALDYLQSNRPSQANIWVCSDLRRNDCKSTMAHGQLFEKRSKSFRPILDSSPFCILSPRCQSFRHDRRSETRIVGRGKGGRVDHSYPVG